MNPGAKLQVDGDNNQAWINTTGSYSRLGFSVSNVEKSNIWYASSTGEWGFTNTGGGLIKVVNGSLGVSLVSGGTSWGSLSDERKKNIAEPIADALDKTSRLRTVMGTYKDDPSNRHPFLITQDVQKVLPEAISIDKDGYLSLRYTEVIPLLTAAIKELKAKNDALEARIAALEK